MNKIWDIKKYSDKIAMIDENGISLNYEQLYNETITLAEAVKSRCLVFCLCRNEIGSILGYIAFINNGIVPVLLNNQLEEDLLDELMRIYTPAYLWIPQDMIDRFPEMNVSYSTHRYCLVQTKFGHDYPLNEELALLLTTSGSTGSPKFVRQSYNNVLSNAESIAEYLELDDTERAITTLPMNYTYGLSIINSHILVGATLLVTEKGLMQKDFWTFFREQKATSFGGVPYTYEMLNRLRFQNMDLPSLKYMTQAGGKLTVELHEKFAKYAKQNNKKFIVMYGQCEATARMGYLPADKAIEKCGSMGVAIPGGEFKLIDDKGEEILEPHVTGELVYKGPNVTLGYAEVGEDLIKGDERGGVLLTGDMAQFDEDGFYYIVGRKKRFLKIYGNRVNLDEIDRLIKGSFENIDVASSGVDDHLYVFLTDKGYTNRIKDFLVNKTKLNPAAFNVITIDSIPKNDAGKIQYRELAKYYT